MFFGSSEAEQVDRERALLLLFLLVVRLFYQAFVTLLVYFPRLVKRILEHIFSAAIHAGFAIFPFYFFLYFSSLFELATKRVTNHFQTAFERL